MVTQLLFGERFRILEEQGSWCKIKIAEDGYECWIGAKQFFPISGSTFIELEKSKSIYSYEFVQAICNKSTDQVFPIVLGSTRPQISKIQHSVLKTKCMVMKV